MMQRKEKTLLDDTLFVQKLKLNNIDLNKNPTVSESSAPKAELKEKGSRGRDGRARGAGGWGVPGGRSTLMSLIRVALAS